MEKITVTDFDDGVTLIAINRPERRNAICAQTAIELQQAFAAFDRSDTRRVAVLTGTGSMEFAEVGMQPGKPQGFGLLGKRRVPLFTLPGNPVSVLVSFEVFVRPALARLAGRRHTPVTVPAVVQQGWSSPEGRQQYHRVRLTRDAAGTYAAAPVGGAGSHLVGGLAMADGLAVVPAEITQVATGAEVPVLPLRPVEEIEADLAASTDRDTTAASSGQPPSVRGSW